MTKSQFDIALSNQEIEEQKIQYLKGNIFTSFSHVSCLRSEDWNIILDMSGYSMHHVYIPVVSDLTRYHTYCVKEKQDRDI